MGNFRSRSGCLTCRARRVKCDELRPTCKACSKKNRPCQWDGPQNKFKAYHPGAESSKSATGEGDAGSDAMEVDSTDGGLEESQASSSTAAFSPEEHHEAAIDRGNSRTTSRSDGHSSATSQHSPSSVALPYSGSRPTMDARGRGSGGSGSGTGSGTGSVSDASQVPSQIALDTRPYSKAPVPLTHDEAVLVHHYTEHLGRWLDCTDATRQFTLGVPRKVKLCPVLCYAVLSFAARHRKEEAIAEAAYQKCIALLITRLDEDAASHDETLLCAIVILRFYEQLTVPSTTGSDDGKHLAGTSAILRASQGHDFVDPSAPTLREAAFWVYVRQCLYVSTINQQPPNIDFSLQLHPTPVSMQTADPLARLLSETAWANQMTWTLAHVVNYCFDGSDQRGERANKSHRWQELWDQVEKWATDRPVSFDPIWQGEAAAKSPIPEIWFTSDWHIVSFGFYHFACIMLLTYKPGPKFAIHNAASLSDTNKQLLDHARVICGACKCSPETVPLSMTVCHTIFIWGPLVTDPTERDEIIQLLVDFENNHFWPTTWIINAVKREWGME